MPDNIIIFKNKKYVLAKVLFLVSEQAKTVSHSFSERYSMGKFDFRLSAYSQQLCGHGFVDWDK